MIRTIGRLLGAVVRLVLFALVLSLLVSTAVSMGVIELGDDSTIETPEPLPDWPFVWEIPLDSDSGLDQGPRSDTVNESDRSDPGSTRLESGDTSISSDEIEAHVHERINAIRTRNDLSRLSHDDTIARVSRTHSYDMGERDYFSHVSPEGENVADRFGDLYPRRCHAVGENLALRIPGATNADEIAEQIVSGWMNSQGHRKNILTPRWDSHGIGVYVDGTDVYVTQNFCDEW